MPIFFCRWPNGDLSIVAAPNKEEAAVRLVGCAKRMLNSLIDRRTMTICLIMVLSLFIAGFAFAQNTTQGSSRDCEGPTYKAKEVSKRARITSYPPPKPSKDKKAGEVRGTVVLKVILCRTGRVTNIEVLEKLPHGITKTAIEAAQRVQFIPAEKTARKFHSARPLSTESARTER